MHRRLLRKILVKFSKYEAGLPRNLWGTVYCGADDRQLSPREEIARQQIYDSSMTTTRANSLVGALEPNSPFYSRLEFIELLAALSKIHVDQMRLKVQGASKPLKHILWCSCYIDAHSKATATRCT